MKMSKEEQVTQLTRLYGKICCPYRKKITG